METRVAGHTLLEFLVVILVVSLALILIAMLSPIGGTLTATKAARLSCAANLQQIAHFSLLYAENNGGYFPAAPDGSSDIVASYQDLLDNASYESIDPRALISPVSEETVSTLVVDGKLILSAENLGYTYMAVPGKLPIAPSPLTRHNSVSMAQLQAIGEA